MKKLVFVALIIAINVMNLGGCDSFAKRHLKEPVKILVPAIEMHDPFLSTEMIHATQNHVKAMMNRIEIYEDTEDKNTEIESILEDCLWFLVEEFGEPVYQGWVRFVITDEPAENAFMVWNENDDQDRQIVINHYNLIKPFWYHYVVHELFHAFYQSNEFLKNNPDSIIEGLAIYAQYKFKYRGLSHETIKDKMYERANAIQPGASVKGIDWNRPFQSYGERDRRYVYLLSGLLFFSQDTDDIKDKISRILDFPSYGKMEFEDFAAIFELKMEGDMFKAGGKKELDLPEPTVVLIKGGMGNE